MIFLPSYHNYLKNVKIMQNIYTFLFGKDRNLSKFCFLILLLFFNNKVFAQTNPPPFNLSIGTSIFTGLNPAVAIYSINMQGWNTGGTTVTTQVTNPSIGNLPLITNGTATTVGIANLGLGGFQFLSSGTQTGVGAICLSLNTTNRSNILATWTAADQTLGNTRQTNLCLQYRIGSTGNFTSISGSTYNSSNSSQQAAATFTNLLLPADCENKPIVQLRWLYYETVGGSGARDAISLDQIFVTSSPFIVCTTPTSQSQLNNFSVSVIAAATNTITPVITAGNGVGHIIVVKQGSAVTSIPVDGVDYLTGLSSNFSLSTSLIGLGEKVVYRGTGSTTVTGLIPNTIYHFAVFEFSATNCYLSPASILSINTFSCTTPITAINATITNATSNTATLSWTNGNSTNRLVVLNAGANITGVPTDGEAYTANSDYSLALPFTPGTGKVVYNGTGSTVNLTGLLNNTTYYAQVFEYKAISNCYSSALSTSFSTGVGGFAAFDNFDRANNNLVGIPSSGGAIAWSEIESGANRATVEGNQLRLSTSNTPTVGGNNSTAREMISFDMTGKYATTFSNANGDLEWYFNMRQTRANPSGFSNTTYGAAFIIGCDKSDFTDPTASGYAVIIGNSAAANPDLVKLVYFTNGLVGTYPATGINDIAVSTEAGATPAYSVHVTYNPCTNLWSLQVRNDGASFANPTVGALGSVYTGTNNIYANVDLKYMGALWNHQGPVNGSDDAYFDNFFIPLSAATVNTYAWNGITSSDYQTPTNWTPARNCPKINDVLVFDATSPAVSNVTNVLDQTIGKLLVSGNTNVSFKDVTTDATFNFLTIGGGVGDDFIVAAGSTFNFDVSSTTGNNSLIVTLLTGTKGDVSGTVNFRNSFSNTQRPHQLFATDPNSIIVKSGGIIRAEKLTADPFGTTGNQNVVVFQSGSIYESNDGSNPFGFTQPQSRVTFQTGSLYRHKQTASPSFPGRIYANFEYDFPSGTTSITAGSNMAFMTADDFTVVNGTLNVTGTFTSSPVNMNIKGDLIVANGATFNYSPGAVAYASTIGFTSSSSIQKINSAGTIIFGRFATLELNNTHTIPRLDIETDIRIQGTLKITAGNLNLTTGNITMQSDATSTANVTPVNGTVTYSTGRFITERFITSGRKWRFLSVPLISTQTIRDAWMEGAVAPVGPGFVINNPLAGYGTVITDENNNAVANGFDSKSLSGPSLKYYDPLSITGYTGIASPNVGINSQQAYIVYIRGDRSCLAANSNISTTILRTKGQLNIGDVNVGSFSAGAFKAIGNPYPSRIDLRTIYANAGSNFSVNVYVWDPLLVGIYGLGGFQTLSLFGADFIIVPGGGSYGTIGSVQNYIESGQGFFVRANAGAGNVQIKESDKVAGSSVVNFTSGGNLIDMQNLKVSLMLKDALSNTTLVDGALVVFDENANNEIDFTDAQKLKNTSENISIKTNNNLLAVEQKALIENNDSIHLNIAGLRIANYQLKLEPNKLERVGRKAYLIDNYLQTKTILNLLHDNNIDFNVNSNAGSYAANRFVIVFKQLPIPSFVNVLAEVKADKLIIVKWNIANENGIEKYEVERSNDGIFFSNISNKLPFLNNNNDANFAVQDAQPLATDNYYRIKMIFENGTYSYSKIVKVDKITDNIEISISPNIISNKILTIQFLHQLKGRYIATILNAMGEKILQKTISVTSFNMQEKIKIDNFSAGIYTLLLLNESGKKISNVFVVE